MSDLGWLAMALAGVGLIVAGAEAFAEHLAAAASRLGVSTFAVAVLLAGAEPEEMATAITAARRHAPAIALGDVVGANVAVCLVALGAGAVLAPLPFDRQVRRYAWAGLPAGGLAAAFAWDGLVTRVEAVVLVAVYVAFVAVIWRVERRPPPIGELGELERDDEPRARGAGIDLAFVVGGVAAIELGAMTLVEGIRRISDVESTQTWLGIVVVGFATAFELVVLAWSTARRGITAAVVAGVVGSFTYNVTMTLGAGALARPLRVSDPGLLRGPWLLMLAALAVVIALAGRTGRLGRPAGAVLLALYPLFVAAITLLT